MLSDPMNGNKVKSIWIMDRECSPTGRLKPVYLYYIYEKYNLLW